MFKQPSTEEEGDSFASLHQLYKIDTIDLTTSFIRKYPHLIGVLLEAHEQIKRVFHKHVEEVRLQYVRDPEENFEGLSVDIRTNLSPELSLDLLDRFDEEWWLDVNNEVRAELIIMVEPKGG